MNSNKTQHHIVLGITSGIAAFKMLEFIELLQKENIKVSVILTQSAQKMISFSEVEKITGQKVYTDMFEEGFDYKTILKTRHVQHIDLADSADLFLVSPATANVIAKLAYGFADDFLTTTALAVTCPIAVCPSMNVHMWKNQGVQENIATLQKRGVSILGPDNGMLACGYTGEGRLIDLQKLLSEVKYLLQKRTVLKGKKVIVTSGGTKEKIDDVRFITNKSNGKMGVSLAEEAYLSGADILLLRASDSSLPSLPIKYEEFKTSQELFDLIKQHVANYDVIFHTAAVSDFTVQETEGKLESNNETTLHLTPAPKIIDEIKKINPNIILVGFKAEWNLSDKDLIQKGLEKLKKTHADMIVVNDVSHKNQGFGSDTNEVFIVHSDGSHKKIPLSPKRVIARKIIDELGS